MWWIDLASTVDVSLIPAKIPFLIYFQITKFEKLESDEERIKTGKDIYDQFIMKELLSQSHVSKNIRQNLIVSRIFRSHEMGSSDIRHWLICSIRLDMKTKINFSRHRHSELSVQHSTPFFSPTTLNTFISKSTLDIMQYCESTPDRPPFLSLIFITEHINNQTV